MSELFLDTEVRPAIPHIALACVQSGYNDAVLEHIFIHEVSPVLWINMIAVAGEWALFEEEWLLERLREVPFPASRWRRFKARFRYVPKDDWWLTMELTRYLRGLPDDQRQTRAASLAFLIEAYVSQGGFVITRKLDEDPRTLKRIFAEELATRLPRVIVDSVEKWTHEDGCRYVERAIAARAE